MNFTLKLGPLRCLQLQFQPPSHRARPRLVFHLARHAVRTAKGHLQLNSTSTKAAVESEGSDPRLLALHSSVFQVGRVANGCKSPHLRWQCVLRGRHFHRCERGSLSIVIFVERVTRCANKICEILKRHEGIPLGMKLHTKQEQILSVQTAVLLLAFCHMASGFWTSAHGLTRRQRADPKQDGLFCKSASCVESTTF